MYNQTLSIAVWGLSVYAFSTRGKSKKWLSGAKFDGFLGICLLQITLAIASTALTGLPMAISAKLGLVLVAAVPIFCLARVTPLRFGLALSIAVAVVAFINCLPALVEAFHPTWVDDDWIASAGSPDRISGNIRQANLLATMCALGAAAFAALVGLSIVPKAISFGAVTVLSLTLALTGSRVGFGEVLLIALAGLCQPSLNPSMRRLMLITPVLAMTFWAGLQSWSNSSGELHARAPDFASGRYVMWWQCLQLIAAHPWLGVGFGNFNFAWTLTPFDRSNPETFDHVHNLILQWAIEFGIPIALLLIGLLTWSLWHCVRFARQATGAEAIIRRFCLLMVAVVLLHSMAEYPLWYAHYLLPTVFAWGIAAAPIVRRVDDSSAIVCSQKQATNWKGFCGLLMALGAAFVVYDYDKIIPIWRPYDDTPIEQRVAESRESILFGHLADRFAGTLAVNGTRTLEPFKTATRQLLDMRLLIAWSLAMRETGHLDKARYLAQRIKEFNDPVAQQFFDKCNQSASGRELPWQCTPPTGHYSYQDFL